VLGLLTLCTSCSGTPANEQPTTPPIESTAPPSGYPDNAYVITDYYNEDGTFSELGLALNEINSEKTLVLREGDIFIVSDRQYIIAAETLTFSFYTQSSFAEVIQWWTDYVKLWEESGIISAYSGVVESTVTRASENDGSANNNGSSTPIETTNNSAQTETTGNKEPEETKIPENTVKQGSTDYNDGVTAPINPYGNVGPRGSNVNDPANGIYVSPAGNDAAATGSIDKPYKSINAALAAANPGDTIILRGGTYREGVNVRVRTPNITIKSAKGEWAVIDLTTHDPGADEDSGVYFDVESSGGTLQCVEVKGGFYAVCLETKWDWGDPANRTGASNIVIEDCVLHDSKYDVVKVKPNCDNVTIRYNEIYNSGRAFIGNPANGEDNAEGIDNVNGDNMTVQNNYIHDIRGNGIYAKGGATDALIENNRIEHVYGGGILVGFDTSPEFFDLTVNPQYYENIRGVVRNNLIIDIGWEGIGFYGSKDAQVYNNTLINVANGGQYHSAVYFGLTYQDWENYAGRPPSVNPNIHHNIICQSNSIVRPMIEIRYANELGGMSALDGNPVMNDNCYYITGKSATFNDRRPGSTLTNAGLTAWKTHISGDSGSLETDPALDADYMPTNPLCAGMGIISGPFSPPTPPPTQAQTPDP